MIDVESPHNAIRDRPWLHMMRAVPSSYHQLLRYPTLMETTNIRVDQAVAQSITAITRKKSVWVTRNARVTSDEDPPRGRSIVGHRSITIT